MLQQLQGHSFGVGAVCVVSQEGTPMMVSLAVDGTCRYWDYRANKELQRFVTQGEAHSLSKT